MKFTSKYAHDMQIGRNNPAIEELRALTQTLEEEGQVNGSD
ncbi:hypothetical protein ACFLWD_02900 [Chloroflexota bacterium]